MKRMGSVVLLLALVTAGFAIPGSQPTDRIVPGITRGTQGTPETNPGIAPVYTPASRQNVVLFVEDWSGAFGCGTQPDPNWNTLLTNIVGAGEFGWYATTATGQDGPDLATMQTYPLVIWNCYDDWWSGNGLTTNDQTNIANYIAAGGKVWLIGQDIIYGGVSIGWLGTNFHLASVIEDVNTTTAAAVQGQTELAGLNTTFNCDYAANTFFSDALTPDANAHYVLFDGTSSTYPAIAYPNTGDFATSFWAIDGRNPTDWATWEQMVYTMLDKFGVLFNVTSYVWDFETGLQDWTHTNGVAFPGGWDVEWSQLHASWACPEPGDSSMWIDSDDYGSIDITDTAWSPVVRPPVGMVWLKYGLGFYWYSGGNSEWVEVGVNACTSGVWTGPVGLRQYIGASWGPAWDSIDVSTYAGADSIRVFFSYNNAHYEWYCSFDNVTLFAPLSHDVSAIAINVPGSLVLPGTSYDPTATYANVGGNAETFDVYFTIDSAGTNIYLETASVTVDPGNDTTVVFPSWIAGPNGNTYNLTAYTVLAGDENPANDTVTATTNSSSAAWKIYSNSMPAAVYYHGTAWTDVTGSATVYSLGGGTGSTAYNTIYAFDCPTETWSTLSTVLNHAVQRNVVAKVNDKIYSISGGDAALNPVSYNQEFDPVAGTVTDRAPIPTAAQFAAGVAWRDTLIYFVGGQTSSGYLNTVQIYDPTADAWTTGTSLPITNRSFGIGICGDTIYVAGGYNSSGYVTGAYMGVIDPATPTSITWTAIANIPTGPSGTPGRSRLQGAGVEGKFYFTGGDDHGVPAYDTWYFDPALMSWIQTLDKPTPISNTQCAVYVPVLDGGTFFCPGGYNTAGGAGTGATEGLIGLAVGVEENPGSQMVGTAFGFAPVTNPIKGYAGITYTLTQSGRVSLKVFDYTGRLVTTLVDGNQAAGTRSVLLDAAHLANGIYFVRLQAEGNAATLKLVLVR